MEEQQCLYHDLLDFFQMLALELLAVIDVITKNKTKIKVQQIKNPPNGIIPHLHEALDASGSHSRHTLGFLARFGFV